MRVRYASIIGKPFVCAVLAAAALISPSLASDWPMFRGDAQRTGYSGDVVGYPSKQPDWVDTLNCAVVSSPSVVKGVLYIGGRDSAIYAINAGSGKILWKRKTKGWIDSSPLVMSGRVIVGSRDGTVYILDAANGDDVSFLDAGLQLSSPAMMADGTILCGMGLPYHGVSGYTTVLPKWTRTNAAWTVAFGQTSYSSPALYGQAVVLGANDGRLYGLDGQSGKIVWSVGTAGSVYMSSPAIDKDAGTVYFAPGDGDAAVYAVDLVKGQVLWRSEGLPALSLSKRIKASPIPPAQLLSLLRFSPQYRQPIIDGLLRKSAMSGGLLAKAAATLTDATGWMATGGLKTSSVAIDEANVYVVQKALGLKEATVGGSTNYQYMPSFTLLALDKKTGVEKWRFSELRNCARIGYCSSPLASKRSVFVGWGDGALHVLDKTTGKPVWSDTLHADIISSPAIADGKLFIATLAGTVSAYNLLETAPGLDFPTSTYCYPNPARGSVSHIQVYVNRPAQMSMVVYTMADKPVFRKEAGCEAGQKQVFDWNLAGVANGVYFAHITVHYSDGAGQTEKKVVKIAVLR